MKKCMLSVLMIFAISYVLVAQPTTITYQGKLLDNEGNAVTNHALAMSFAIYDAETGGTLVWPDNGTVAKTVDVAQGLYSVQLGTGIGVDDVFTAAMFEGKSPWIEVTIGTEILPRSPVSNVPFALVANELAPSGWASPGEIGATTADDGHFNYLTADSITLSEGASAGKILVSDATGKGKWTSLSAAEINGLGNMALQDSTDVSISGGQINGTPIGSAPSGASTGTFTTLNASNDAAINGNLTVGNDNKAGGGNITAIGVTTAGNFATDGTLNIKSDVTGNTLSGLTTIVNVTENSLGYGAALYPASDGSYQLANGTNLDRMPCIALAIETGTGWKKVLLQGFISNSTWNWTVGKVIYVSLLSGELTQSPATGSDSQIQIVGVATHTTRILFNPNLMLIELK